MVAGELLMRTLFAPSPKPPTNVAGLNLTETGDAVVASALNLTTATVPVPVIGDVVDRAPTVMVASPD